MINSPGSSLYQLFPSKWPMPLISLGCLPGSVCTSIWERERNQCWSILRMAGLYHPILQMPLSESSLSKHHSVCFCLFRKTSDIKAGFTDSLTRSGPIFRWSSLYRMGANRDEIVMVHCRGRLWTLRTGSVCPELLSWGSRGLAAYFWTPLSVDPSWRNLFRNRS